MRLLAMSLLFCAALTTGCFAAERISPPLPDRRLKNSMRQTTPNSRRPLATRWATRYRNALSSRRHSAARKRFSSGTAHAIATVTRRKSISSGCATAKSPSGKNFCCQTSKAGSPTSSGSAKSGHSRSLTTPKCTSAFAGPAPISRRSRLPRSESNGWSAQARDAGC